MSEQCHYCHAARGCTRDHIVPRREVRPLGLPASHPFHSVNVVFACQKCNTAKAARRSTCACERCRRAWDEFYALWRQETVRP